MKRKFSLPKDNSTKKRKIAKPSCGTHLFEDDYKEIISMCRAEGVGESEALRLIVSEWMRDQRVKALGKDHVEDPIRRIYERVITEQLAPLSESVRSIKSSVEKLSQNRALPAAPGYSSNIAPEQSSGIMAAINELKSILEQTGSDLSENGASQIEILDSIQKSQTTLHAITSETFAAGWTIADLLVRYVVEVNLRDQNKLPDEVEQEVALERRGLRMEGLKKIAGIEDFLELPEGLRIAQLVLSSRSFPMTAAQSPPV